MLLTQLSNEDAYTFLCLAELISQADQPALWNGEPRSNMSQNTMFTNVTIGRNERRTAALKELSWILGHAASINGWGSAVHSFFSNVQKALTRPLTGLPLKSEDNQAIRLEIATGVLREILKDKKSPTPSVPKLMMFELLLLALTDGAISSIQWQLLTEFGHHFDIEDYLFRDLLARAEITYTETQKTIAIILE